MIRKPFVNVPWTTPPVMQTIAHGAPDYFSIRSDIFLFPASESDDLQLEPTLGDFSDDTALLGLNPEERLEWIETLKERIQRLETQKQTDERDLQFATALDTMGRLQRISGNYSAALAPLKCALAIHEYVLGSEHPDTARSLNNLAGLYHSQGDYERALPLF